MQHLSSRSMFAWVLLSVVAICAQRACSQPLNSDGANSALKPVLDAVNEELHMSRMLGGSPQVLTKIGRSESDHVLEDCMQLLSDASELVETSIRGNNGTVLSSPILADIQTWMSAALTYHTTCMDALRLWSNAQEYLQLRRQAIRVREGFSAALSQVASAAAAAAAATGAAAGEPSAWVPEAEVFFPLKATVPNVVVAQDGSGDYSTISQAIEAAPSKSQSVYVVHVKQGTYKEKVSVPKSKTNLMLVGDGEGKTIITGSRNVHDGSTTFRSATVEVSGHGFLARDLTIQNTAGPSKHQAVALRVSADKAAFYRCSFEGYQDTLYAHSFRQFYRDCNIYGTVDFIFGDAAAVFQSCNLVARLPMAKQKNTYTAQGRSDPNQNTGFSFQDCKLDGTKELRRSRGVSTYLGRPWQKYSRTLFLDCYEGGILHPAGWLEWSGSFALKTLYYGEYKCQGPGAASASKRVGWSRQLRSKGEASKFTAGRFISGEQWLRRTSFPFKLGL